MFNRDYSFLQKETPEFSEELFQKELRWLKRKESGDVLTKITPGSWKFAIGSALVASFFIGGSFGALFGTFFRKPSILFWSLGIVFIITLLLANRNYATIEFDVEERQMKYQGKVFFGGETRAISYHGPIEVINGTQVVKHNLFNKYYIRFVTSSGYLRMPYEPSIDQILLEGLEILGLIDLDQVTEAIKSKNVIRKLNQWNVYFETIFDRSEFLEKYRLEQEEKLKIKEEIQEEERKKRIERSKKRVERAKARRKQVTEKTDQTLSDAEDRSKLSN